DSIQSFDCPHPVRLDRLGSRFHRDQTVDESPSSPSGLSWANANIATSMLTAQCAARGPLASTYVFGPAMHSGPGGGPGKGPEKHSHRKANPSRDVALVQGRAALDQLIQHQFADRHPE